jgi:phosphohistidine swiveling domain-containing protein
MDLNDPFTPPGPTAVPLPTILDAVSAHAAGERAVGGKAFGLARLVDLGCTVPAFVVVPGDVFRAHLRRAGVLDAIDRMVPGVPVEGEELRAAVLATPVDPGLAEALAAPLAARGAGPWAVRSSMVGEDSVAHSFAGQLDSFLFLPDLDAVVDAVRACWASPFGERALAYATRAGLELGSVRMGVVVQKMVDAEVSAVAFTANPVSGDRRETLITATWGQGEGIVSGLCNTDEHRWTPTEGERETAIADKDVRVVADAGGQGTVEEPVPDPQRVIRALTEEQVHEIGLLGQRLQEAFGGPQDIELCYAEDVLHILQARPVTSLPEPLNDDGPLVLWDNSNIQESYCGVTTPLTFSFASAKYAAVYETFFRIAGVSDQQLRRVFYNLNNWYEGVLHLPAARHNKHDMEQMMGVEEPVEFVVDEEVGRVAQLRRTAGLAPIYARILPQLLTAERRITAFQAHVRVVIDKVDRPSLPSRSFSDLMDHVRLLDRELIGRWDVPILNDLRVMQTSGSLRRFVAGALNADQGDPEVRRLCNDLIAGIDGIESVEPTRMLLSMAAIARRDEHLEATLRAGDAGEALAAIRRDHLTFAARIDEYLDRYGDRVMGELKLESTSLREDPRFVVEVLRNYLDRPDLDPSSVSTRERVVHLQALAEVEQYLTGRRSRAALVRKVDNCREAVKARESLRLERTRVFGLYRDIYRAIGERLHEVGRLDEPGDVLYLTVDELLAHHEGRSVTKNLAGLARLRRADFAAYERHEIPNRFETKGPVGHGNRYTAADSGPADRAATLLRGTGCYPGVVESTVRLIHSPTDELSINGRILVTVRTDPGWAPLFPTCSGLLVERGSTLSHSAVVARELGIPAIVGIPDLTRIVEDGESVRMDGAAGTIERAVNVTPPPGAELVDPELPVRNGRGMPVLEGSAP